MIEVRRSDHAGRGGRGVFARVDISAQTLIERVPVLLMPTNQVFGDAPDAQRHARLSWYVFDWEGVTKRSYVALALGYGSIYNHSYEPNAIYKKVAPDILEFHAIKNIAADEEITINYHGDPNDMRPMYFDMK
ncbi:MAG: SET domain-containing protein-lysine N-methyltransferase [Burkholderiales bacterium]|nr:SET domain-containing protein-lysine N-methyltransferase [Phycisphaerae bacterium]